MRKGRLNLRCSFRVLAALLVLTLLFTVPQVQPVVVANWRGQTEWQSRANPNAGGSSNVTFFVSPALQVNITFNGRNYTNSQSDIFLAGNYTATATLAKSLTTAPPPPTNCPPGTFYTSVWQFYEWKATNNLTIQGSISSNPANVSVAGSGNLTANLIRGEIGCPADVFPPGIAPLYIMGIVLTTLARFRKRLDP